MADRYWVGGTGTWSSGNTANWSTTSGGAGGASVPGSLDLVIIDANSGSGTITFTNSAVTVNGVSFDNVNITLSLGAAFSTSGTFTLATGTLTTNNFNFTSDRLSSSNTNTRTINLGSSNVTLTGDTPLTFGTSTNLTFSAGTSTVTCSNNTITFRGGGQTFWNVSFTAANLAAAMSIEGANTFNNLSFAGRTSVGVNAIAFNNNQVINGTLAISPGSVTGSMRTFLQSSAIGTTRTLTCAAVATLVDIDFRDITIAGAAAPVSGTRLGDCGGNSGITFPAPKTVWWNISGNQNWTATGWATSVNGTTASTNFPLAQDTATFSNSGPGAGAIVTINANFNIGSINLSSRTTSLTLTVSTNSPVLYGSFTNGTNITIGGTGTVTFSGRGANTLLTAGRAFNPALTVAAPGGSLTLSDALTCASSSAGALRLTTGTLNTGGYSVSLTNGTGTFIASGIDARTLNMGASTITVAASGTAFTVGTATNMTLTGTGTISLTSASAKTFAGGGIQTYPTLNQGGTGTLTVTGSNKFANITDTAIGRVQFTGGTTNIFDAFNLGGVAGNLLQLGSTTTTQATLQKKTAWLMGANSTDGGNNTNLSFTAGGGIDYLSVSYINGVVVSPQIDASLSESVTVADATASAFAYAASIGEATNISDSTTLRGAFRPVSSETASAADTIAAFEIVSAAIAETSTAFDLALVSSVDVAVFLQEGATGADTAQTTAAVALFVQEVVQAADTINAGFSITIGVTESATAQELVDAGFLLATAIQEAATSADNTAVAASDFGIVYNESAVAQDALQVQYSGSAALSETATGSDSGLATAVFSAYVMALVQKTAPISVGNTGAGSLIFNRFSFGDAVIVAANGTGVGDNGGFASDGNYIVFRSTPFVTSAYLQTVSLSFANVASIRITAIRGNGSNGGAATVVPLRLRLLSGIGAELAQTDISVQGSYTTTNVVFSSTIRNSVRFLELSASLTSDQKPNFGITEITFVGVGDAPAMEDTVTNTASMRVFAQETATVQDSPRVAPSVFRPVALAAAQAAESLSPIGTYNVTLPTEQAAALDSLIGAFLWNLINNDSHDPGWQNIDIT